MYNAQNLAHRIKQKAKQKDVLIKDMLVACDLNINTLSQISDKKGLSSFSLARIADYLDCSVDYLLGRTDKQTLTHSTSNINSNFVQSNGSVTLGSVSVGSTINNSSNNISLSEEEMELLDVYRSLNIRGKAKFLNMALDIEKEKSN